MRSRVFEVTRLQKVANNWKGLPAAEVVQHAYPVQSFSPSCTWAECSSISIDKHHARVKIISRDRQGLLAKGGRRGAAAAEPVADRFHLIQILKQALARRHSQLWMPAVEFLQQKHVWSNGPVEGHINRLKTMKRQMWQTNSQKITLFRPFQSMLE
jgi:hypothetical protein